VEQQGKVEDKVAGGRDARVYPESYINRETSKEKERSPPPSLDRKLLRASAERETCKQSKHAFRRSISLACSFPVIFITATASTRLNVITKDTVDSFRRLSKALRSVYTAWFSGTHSLLSRHSNLDRPSDITATAIMSTSARRRLMRDFKVGGSLATVWPSY
jgi:hypothetical protein